MKPERKTIDVDKIENNSPKAWYLYFGCDPRDIALDFIQWGITKYDQVAKFVEKHDGGVDPSRIFFYIQIYLEDLRNKQNKDISRNSKGMLPL